MKNQQEADLLFEMGNLLRLLGDPQRKKLDADQKKHFDQTLNITRYEIERTVDHLNNMLNE